MNRIAQRLESLQSNKLLVPFFTFGFPDIKTSLDLVRVAFDSGVDIVELGVPFSDPMADGPEIQLSSKVALDQGTTLRHVLDGVAILRKTSDIPIVLMGYYNPVLTYGKEKFVVHSRKHGVDGFIIPDLPIDESVDFTACVETNQLSMIFMVAPTTSRQRLTLIDRKTTDLVYAVTVTGVTGTGKTFDAGTETYLRYLKRNLSKPFVAGFGVDSPESAQRLCHYSDGVVIGSALVKIIRNAGSRQKCLSRVGKFLTSVRKAI
ncbi:MAG: tryptophan synthase subunit alpha [candidate division Zixibacteria bacterium]|nr:tryptophan synthase subunit alpha [candidate division Zixibacteria bacterium]